MMLKTLAVLFFVAVCAALPVDDIQLSEDELAPAVDPQTNVLDDQADLKTDATYWQFGAFRYPQVRRYYYVPRVYSYYRPVYTPYWGAHW